MSDTPSNGAVNRPEVAERTPPSGFEMIQGFGYALIFALALVAVAVPETGFLAMWKDDANSPTALTVAKSALFATLLVLSVRWIDATRKELRLWLVYTSINMEPRETTAAIISIAFYLGLSIAFVAQPLWITAYFSAGTAVSCWTQWRCCYHFCKAGPRKPGGKVPESMTVYYRDRPHVLRIVLTTVFACIAFGFALTGKIRGGAQGQEFTLAAYWILIADVIVAEAVIARWRHVRQAGIPAEGL